MLTPLENQLVTFAQAPQQSLDAVTAGPMIAMNFLISGGQDPSDATKQLFSLSPSGIEAMQAAFAKLQQFNPTAGMSPQPDGAPPAIPFSNEASNPAIAADVKVGTTTVPGSGNTEQVSFSEMTPTTVGDDNPFPLVPMVPEKKKGRPVGQTIYPFDNDDFKVGMGFVVYAETNSEEDLKAVRDKLKNAVGGANRRHREPIPGEFKEVTKTRKVQKDGEDVIDSKTKKPKREKYKEKVPVTRQTRKFVTEALEPDGETLGGVRVMRVEV